MTTDAIAAGMAWVWNTRPCRRVLRLGEHDREEDQDADRADVDDHLGGRPRAAPRGGRRSRQRPEADDHRQAAADDVAHRHDEQPGAEEDRGEEEEQGVSPAWPRSTSMIAAMVKTAPITANARTIGISLRSTSPATGGIRRDRRPVPVVPVVSVVQVPAVVGTLAVIVRLDATDRRRQDSQQASGDRSGGPRLPRGRPSRGSRRMYVTSVSRSTAEIAIKSIIGWLAAGVRQLHVRAVAQGVVGARIDADAAQDATALVHLVLLGGRARHPDIPHGVLFDAVFLTSRHHGCLLLGMGRWR